MKCFVHVCKKDEELFNAWLKHTKKLGIPKMIVWAEPDVNLDCKINKRYKSPFEYPKICTDIWLNCVSSINEPVLYLEPDAWPLVPNWFKSIEREYLLLGQPGAMVTADYHYPYDVVGGIGVYDWNKLPHLTMDKIHSEIPEWACFDTWIGTLPDDVRKKTNLIRHSYGVYENDEFVDHHKIDTYEKFVKLTSDGAIFHKDKYGLVGHWVDKLNETGKVS
jgi:hypothetical protein